MVENGIYRFILVQITFINDLLLMRKHLYPGNGEHIGYVHYYKGKFNAYQRTYVLTDFSENILFIRMYLDKFLRVRIESESI